MPLPAVVDEAEWRAARMRLLVQEKELSRHRDAIAAARRQLPMLEITKDYRFTAFDGGIHTLRDLFAGRRQLLVYHFMFDPSWDEGCPSCSYTVDHIGDLRHLHARDTTLVLVSRAPVDKLAAYQKRMGWDVPWFSSAGSDFNYDFHVTIDASVRPVEYNFRDADELVAKEGEAWRDWSGEQPGISAFLRDDDRVLLTWTGYSRAIDMVMGTNHWLDFTVLGRQEDWERPSGRSDGPSMHWLRRHDEYR